MRDERWFFSPMLTLVGFFFFFQRLLPRNNNPQVTSGTMMQPEIHKISDDFMNHHDSHTQYQVPTDISVVPAMVI